MSTSISSSSVSASAPLQPTTPKYAQKDVIRRQRITAVAAIALGCLASMIAGSIPFVGIAAAILFYGGIMVIGASLIQQAVGNAPGCQVAKTRRVIAGILIMGFPVAGWIVGGLLWYSSNKANERAAQLANLQQRAGGHTEYVKRAKLV